MTIDEGGIYGVLDEDEDCWMVFLNFFKNLKIL